MVDNKVVVLIGESASGKSTIEDNLCDSGEYVKAISDTTRPIREGEVDGVDYNFKSIKEFELGLENGHYIEHARYNGWYYGVSKNEVFNRSKPVVLVVNPHGFRQIQAIKELDIISFHIDVDWRTRAKRLIDRGDDLMEIFRRLISDTDVFQDIGNEVDYVVDNDDEVNMEGIINSIREKISTSR